MEGDNVTALTCIPSPHILKFVHHVIDNMCGGMQVSTRHYSECPLEKFWFAVQNVKDLATTVSLEKASKEQALLYLHPLPPERAEEIYDALVARKAEIRKSLVRESIQGVPHLKDFDWNVRLAVASDKVMDLNETLLTLHLHTSATGIENDVKDLSVELSASQVDKFLEQLKDAQKSLALLQSN